MDDDDVGSFLLLLFGESGSTKVEVKTVFGDVDIAVVTGEIVLLLLCGCIKNKGLSDVSWFNLWKKDWSIYDNGCVVLWVSSCGSDVEEPEGESHVWKLSSITNEAGKSTI